jgi:hypothetical protein
MVILGILLLIIFFTGFIISLVTFDSDDFDHTGLGIGLGLVLIGGIIILATGLTKDNPTKHSLNKNTMSIEVKIDLKDGVEVSRDTIYVFTPIPEK